MSPLENHHCSVSFKILSSPECNIFMNLSPEEFKEVRGVSTAANILSLTPLHPQDMIILILATDMARHAEILENFKEKLNNFDYSSEDHLNTLKMILIKACDISNECRPLYVSMRDYNRYSSYQDNKVSEGWLECLLEEYFNQSDLEKSCQLPFAPFMDRCFLFLENLMKFCFDDLRDHVTRPTAQIGFIRYVLLPLFEALNNVNPGLNKTLNSSQ